MTAMAVVALALHVLVLVWHLNHPDPLPMTETKALPMIDIDLAVASAGAPEETKPLPPKPVPPKPKSKPVEKPKPKPKPKPVKVKPEVKKPDEKPQLDEAKPAPTASPIRETKGNLPVVGNKANMPSKPSQSGKVMAARGYIGYLSNPKPNYPGIARSRHWEGLVLLRVYVTPNGQAAKVNVARSSGHDVLDDAALAAVRNWRFVPGKRGDMPIASWATVPIQFALRN